MSCTIILHLGNEIHSFNSNEELDGWLFTNRGRLSLKEKDITYSLSTMANSKQKETYGRIKGGAMHVRNQIDNGATSGSINPERKIVKTSWSFAQDFVGADEDVKLPARRPYTGVHISDEEQEFRQTIGHDFEKAFEKALNPTYVPKYKIIKDDNRIKWIEDSAKQVLDWIKYEHGQDCEILTQVEVGTKEIGADFLNAIRGAANWSKGVTGGTNSEINAFTGDIDVVVIDRRGVVHIYDFKTSSGNPNTHSDPTYAKQIGIYRQMVRQSGVVTGNVALIPIKMNYGGTFINDDSYINGITFDSARISKIEKVTSDEVNGWFPAGVSAEFSEIEDLTKVMKEFTPGSGLDSQTEFRKATLEEELKRVSTVKEANPEYKNGNRYQYKKHRNKPGTPRFIYAKDMEDMQRKIEKYLETWNNERTNTYLDFARDLKDAMQLRDETKLGQIATDYNPHNGKYIIYMFRRYISSNWNLVSNELMLSNGIFLFQKGDVMELVMLDNHNPYREMHFDHGKTTRKYTSIFGNFLSDSDGIDQRWDLHCYYGNFLMMKGLTFMSQHPELFNGTRLAKVSVMNLSGNSFMEESNEKLVKNFERWCLLYQNKTGEAINVLKLGTHVMSDSSAYVHIALDLLKRFDETQKYHQGLLMQDAFNGMENKAVYTLQEIKFMINSLRTANGTNAYAAKSSDWDSGLRQAIMFLNKAYLAALGYQISPEPRVGLWSDGGVNISGLNMRPFSRSGSAIGRTLHEAYYSFVRVCQQEYIQYTSKWKLLIQKLYEESGHDKNWGGAWDFFNKFFEHDGDKLNERFILKDRGTMRTETENKVLDMFYDAIDRFKYHNNSDLIKAAIENGTYNEVPLIKSKFRENSSKNGVPKALFEEAKKDWNVMRDLLLDVDVDVDDKFINDLNNLDAGTLPAYVLQEDPKRNEKLQKYINNYTTDLDFIFNLICQQGIRSENSGNIMMITSAIRSSLSFMQWSGNESLDNISAAVENYVKSKIFGRPIHDRKLDTVQATVNMIKGLVSTVTLGANFKSFTRETITGFYRGFERVKLHPQLKNKIQLKYYTEALTELIQHCYENNDIMSFHMQLNQIYGTANFSYNQMAENSTVEQYAIRNLETSDLFFTATWPDFLHRNAIVIAHLKTIGAYDAYKLKDGVLTYDMDLDPRFELLRKYKTEEEVPLGLIKKWREVYNLYKDCYDSWKNNGYVHPDGSEFKFGDKLPQALSPRQVSGLKDIADAMYGNYDEETKSLMTKMLLGSLFLQFRTYGINRLQEFFDGETNTSDIDWIHHKIKNSKGEWENAYIVFDGNNALLGGGGEFARLIPESEVSLEDIKSGKAVEAKTLSSYHINGGYIKQMVDLGVSLFLFKDHQEEFNKLWKENPTYKANMTIFMIDTLGMLLLALLINSIYGSAMEGDFEETEWFTQWAYNVSIGVTQDGPVWSVLSSVVGDGTPPVVSALQSWANNASSVITGRKNFLEGVASTFGATRELAYLFQNIGI